VGVRVGVAYSRRKLTLRTRLRNPKHALVTRLRNLNLKSQFSIFDSFRGIRVQTYDFKSDRGLWFTRQ